MTPTIMFWLDVAAHIVTALITTTVSLLVVGMGARRPLNRRLAGFLGAVLVWAIGSLVLRGVLWLEKGSPLLWTEIAVVGFALIGPTLFGFISLYIEAQQRWHQRAFQLGLWGTLATLPLAFSGQAISRTWLGQDGVLRWQLTSLGYLTALIPLLFEALSMAVVWAAWPKRREPILAAAVTLLFVGNLLGTFISLPLPTVTIVQTLSASLIGLMVLRQQIFNPLQNLAQELEAQVRERTRELEQTHARLGRLSRRQRAAAEIAHLVAHAPTPDEMLGQLARLAHNRLGYHHVFIYQPALPAERFLASEQLVLKAAAGTAARTLLETGHTLLMDGNTLVSRAAIEQEPLIVYDWKEEPNSPGDTALPGVRAEIAVPLRVGGRVVGVMSLQSIHPYAFTEDDLTVVNGLGNQCAILVENARLLHQAKTTLAEMERFQRQHIEQQWRTFMTETGEARACLYTDGRSLLTDSLQAAWSPHIAQAIAEEQAVLSEEPDQEGQVLALPIRLRGQIIGALNLRHKPGKKWQPEEINAVNEFAERLGMALETARLSQEAQRYALRERLIRQITDEMHTTMDISDILLRTVQNLGQALEAEEIAVRLIPSQALSESSPRDDGASQQGS